MKIGILGCGLIGKKRASQLFGQELAGVYDPDFNRMQSLATELGTKSFKNEDELIDHSDIVVIATSNHVLTPLALKAVKKFKHVLVEKPGGIEMKGLTELQSLAAKNKVAIKVGFNHRFHPALLKTRQMIDDGLLGEMMFLRARYGHGGRLGYEKEWRAVPELGGGGELMDQGVHILDLIYWFLGPLPLQNSFVTTSFWKMNVDDNAVLTLSDKKKWATFHVSCTEWKNTFSMELYGRTGKILLNGLGRSYGTETLTYYRMLPEMGPPEVQEFKFEGEDLSWELDLKNLIDHIQKGSPLWGDINSARYSVETVLQAYRQNGFLNLPGTQA